MQNHRLLKASLEEVVKFAQGPQLVNNWAEIWTKPVFSSWPKHLPGNREGEPDVPYQDTKQNTEGCSCLQHPSSSILNAQIPQNTTEQFPNQVFVERRGKKGKFKAVLGWLA